MAGLVVDISAALGATLSPEPTLREPAVQSLEQFKTSNFPSYLASLIAELGNENHDAGVRQAAGLMLKNAVDAKDEARRQELNSKWTALDPTIRQNIRVVLLQCLHSPVLDVRKTTALVISKVGSIDLKEQAWPGLVNTLLANMGAQPPVPGTRQATLMTLGYLCEEVDDDVLQPGEVNLILTAIVAGMGASEANESRLAAIQALINAIKFAQKNFEVDQERNYLMQVVCQGTQAADKDIRERSYTCLHTIAEQYYDKMAAYMTEIYTLSFKSMKEDPDEAVATQALEIWITVAEIELECLDDGEAGTCHNFIKQASQFMVPVLLELLTKSEETQQDDGAWNRSMAAGLLLTLVSKVVKEEVVQMVMPFITTNIAKNEKPDDWHWRDAATFAFGAIMDGPSPASLDAAVRQGLNFLVAALKDPHVSVRDTTAWTLGRIFECVHGSEPSGSPPLFTPEMLRGVLTVLVESLKDEPNVAKHVCDDLAFLAQGYSQFSAEDTSPLSPYFKDIIEQLFACAERNHSSEHASVHIAAFEAVNMLVSYSARDTLPFVAALVEVILNQIDKTLVMAATSQASAERISTLQDAFCGMLSTAITKLLSQEDSKGALLPLADKIFSTLLRVLTGGRGVKVHEGAMLAMGVFITALGEQFMKYMQEFYPYLRLGLQNHQEWQVCLSTIRVLSDLCNALQAGLAPSCDEVVAIMLTNLGSPAVHRSLKPELLSAFGDLAYAIGTGFTKYIEPVRSMLNQAMGMSMQMAQQTQQSQDYDTYDYNNVLRAGILNAYQTILAGLSDEIRTNAANQAAPLKQLFMEEVPKILEFLCSVASDTTVPDELDDTVVGASVSLLGDLTVMLPESRAAMASHQNTAWHALVTAAREGGQGDGRDLTWAITAIQSAVQRVL